MALSKANNFGYHINPIIGVDLSTRRIYQAAECVDMVFMWFCARLHELLMSNFFAR